METSVLEELVKDIVMQAKELKDKYTLEQSASVNYSCIFCHSQEEYDELVKEASKIGEVVDSTPTGPLFHIKPIDTVAGKLRLLKIRAPDRTRPERGDADFTALNYEMFKAEYLAKPGFKLIKRESMEMIELTASGSNVRAYFSNPTLAELLGI